MLTITLTNDVEIILMLKLSRPRTLLIDVGLDVRLKVRKACFIRREPLRIKAAETRDAYRAEKDVGVERSELPDLEDSIVREAWQNNISLLVWLALGSSNGRVFSKPMRISPPVTDEKIDELGLLGYRRNLRQQYTGMRELLEVGKRTRLVSGGSSETGQDIANCAERIEPAPKGKKAKQGSDALYETA